MEWEHETRHKSETSEPLQPQSTANMYTQCKVLNQMKPKDCACVRELSDAYIYIPILNKDSISDLAVRINIFN